MLKIYLARHGQDTDNIAGILNGRRNESLTEKGIEQAHETADKIKKVGISFDVVYSSPLQRAFETAKIITARSKKIFVVSKTKKLTTSARSEPGGMRKRPYVSESARN